MRKLLASLCLSACAVALLPAAEAASSMALGMEPKYPQGFAHFDYVNPDAPKGGEMVLRGFGSFDTLNPYLLKGMEPRGLGLLVETLMTSSMDEPLSVYPLLANDIELAEDELSVTFKLDPKAKFSDGSPVLAEDVKFSFDALMQDGHPQYRVFWADIKQCEVLDERTVRFQFARKNRELHLVIASNLAVFSRAWVGDKAFGEVTQAAPLGSGPYLLDTLDMGKTITYRRNPDYWGADLNTRKGMFNFERITFKYYQDETIALEALKAGDFDFMDMYNSKIWATATFGSQFDSGKIVKTQLPHQNNAGMQGFVFNLRRPLFQDLRVRQAINLAFDFQWTNENLFYGQYQRCDSYFTNSELAAPKQAPSGDELALLKQLQEKFPEEFPAQIFSEVWQPVSTLPPDSLRANLRKAKRLLEDAGWQLRDGVLHNAKGDKLSFSVLLDQRGFERILAPFARNLQRLGIEVNYRTVDRALYKRRMDTFDYDMIVTNFSQSQSPGNEQFSYWHSKSADQKGSFNFIGLSSPLLDRVVDLLVQAEDRAALVNHAHVLDRLLLAGDYVVPNWYIDSHRVLYWDKFGRPAKEPAYYPTGESWAYITWWDKTVQ